MQLRHFKRMLLKLKFEWVYVDNFLKVTISVVFYAVLVYI